MKLVRQLALMLVAAIAAAGLIPLPPCRPTALTGNGPGRHRLLMADERVVRALAVANGVVFLGGEFTSVRPPGSALGTGEVQRNRIAAFNASTGALITSFNYSMNGTVHTLSASPDGTTVYAGGDFTTVDGQVRTRLAAFATGTGALKFWAPSADGRVSASAATNSTLYVGGSFGRLNNLGGRQRLGALRADNGQLVTSFTGIADNVVYSMALSPAQDKLYLAGAFLSVNNDPQYHAVGVVTPSTGANLPFPAASVIPPLTPGCKVELKSVKTDTNGAYFAAEGTGGGCFDGTFAANHADGSLRWISRCLGATQAVEVIGGNLYTGSHAHDCEANASFDPDAFPEVGWARGISRHLLAHSTTDGKLASWYPNTNGGTGAGLGPRVMATDGTQLFVGGEFTTVNNAGQQGFARFSPTTNSALPARLAAPVAVARENGKVSVFVRAPVDNDDTDLIVRLYRDGRHRHRLHKHPRTHCSGGSPSSPSRTTPCR